MATNKITFIAELKDRLTGPTKSAQRAVEDLGAAAERAGASTAAGLGKAERAAESHGRKSTNAHGKAGRAAEGSATRTGRAAGRMERAFQKVDGATGRMASALNKSSGTGATAIERASGRIGRALGRIDSSGAASKFGRGMDSMVSHASNAAAKIESAMMKAGKAVGLAGAGLATASLVGGGKRLIDLESADVKLEVGGYDESARAGIMGTVDEAVTGTPFALNEAATAATQYLAAGVTEGDLGSKLGTTVDMAAVYDMQLGEASDIMSKTLALGTLQGDEANQLMTRGMPIYGALAEQMGVDQSEVKGIISEGKVTADDLFAAIDSVVDGGAQKLGDTTKGVFANMRTAFSRSGALFLAPLQDPVKDLMRSITDTMKGAAPFFTELGERVAPGIAAAAEHAPKLMAALEPLGGPLLAAAGSFADLLPSIVQGLTLWAMILGVVLPPLINLVSFLADLTGPFLPVLIPLLFAVGTGFTTWRVLETIGPALGGVGKLLLFLGKIIMKHPLLWIPLAIYTVAKALGWLYDNVGWVRDGFDWLSNTASTVIGFFDDMGAAIDRLVEDKFPKLHAALDLDAGPLGAISDGLSGAGREAGGGVRSFLGTGEHWGSGEGLFRFMHGAQDEELPHHAEGGWTASGAHKAILGEEGREFVVPNHASEKLASIPGAIPAISQGKLPVTPVPVPVGRGAGQTHGGDTITFNIFDARDPNAVVAVVRSELDKRNREKRLTTSTLTARGAR